jgi:hypothetical protein
MTFYKTTALLGLLLIAVAALRAAGSAEPATKSDFKESLDLRIAQAHLRLAELALEKAQAMNRRVPGTLTGSTIALFVDDVEYAKLQVQSVSKEGGPDAFQACLDRAAMAVRLTENKYQKAAEANRRSPGVLQPADLERWQLAAEVARLELEKGKQLAGASSEAKLQWQLEMLTEEMAQVKQQTHLLGQNRLGQF